jgi:hypothetical protein
MVATAAPEAPPGSLEARASVLTTRRSLVLALAALTTLTEVADLLGVFESFALGGIYLPVSIIPALALGLACGSRLLGRSTLRYAATGFWLAIGVLLPALALLYWREGRIEVFPALILAALNEELVYRLAIPAVIAAALRAGKVRPNAARIAGLTLAGLWFVLLPGHVEQMDTVVDLFPYVAFAGLSALIVYRSGSILPMAIGHAVANLLTVLMWREAVPADTRSLAMASVLALLVLAYGRPSRITHDDAGGLLDTHTGLAVAAIDLRDGQPALVELTDGRVLPVHKRMVVPPKASTRPAGEPRPEGAS